MSVAASPHPAKGIIYNGPQQETLKKASRLTRGAAPLTTKTEIDEDGEEEEVVIVDLEKREQLQRELDGLAKKCKKHIKIINQKLNKIGEAPAALKEKEALTLEMEQWKTILAQINTLREKGMAEEVDINLYPKVRKIVPGEQITIGDLHSNALKLIYYLVKHGILNMEKSDYDTIAKLYRRKQLHLKHVKIFEKILKKATLNPGANLRLIGDELCDRGVNDYLVLLILEKLQDPKGMVQVPLEIIFSNHGGGFIEYYESNFRKVPKGVRPRKSLEGLHDMLKGVDDVTYANMRKRIKEITKNVYIPNLKALSYTIDNTVIPNHITIFTHAPVGLKTIASVARELGLDFDMNKVRTDIYELARIIDNINARFTEIIEDKDLTEKYLSEDSALYRLIWWRVTDEDYVEERIDTIDGHYTMGWGHGHDGDGIVPKPVQSQVRSMDGTLGKGIKSNKGVDVIHVSFEKSANHPSIELAKKAGVAQQEVAQQEEERKEMSEEGLEQEEVDHEEVDQEELEQEKLTLRQDNHFSERLEALQIQYRKMKPDREKNLEREKKPDQQKHPSLEVAHEETKRRSDQPQEAEASFRVRKNPDTPGLRKPTKSS